MATTIGIGHNIRLGRAEIEQAIKLYAHTIMKSRGIVPPHSDAVDFVSRADSHWNLRPIAQTKPEDAVADIVDVYLTWED